MDCGDWAISKGPFLSIICWGCRGGHIGGRGEENHVFRQLERKNGRRGVYYI